MSLNFSNLSITNSIIDLQNQINNLDVDTSDKQDLITSSSDITLNELNSFSVITSEFQTDFMTMNGTLNAPQIEVSGDIYIDGVSVLTKFSNNPLWLTSNALDCNVGCPMNISIPPSQTIPANSFLLSSSSNAGRLATTRPAPPFIKITFFIK